MSTRDASGVGSNPSLAIPVGAVFRHFPIYSTKRPQEQAAGIPKHNHQSNQLTPFRPAAYDYSEVFYET